MHDESNKTTKPQDVQSGNGESRAGWMPRKWDMWHGLLGVVALTLGVTSLWLWSEVRGEKSDSRQALASSAERAQSLLANEKRSGKELLGETREQAAAQQATAFAAAIQPVIGLKGQVPEITDRSIQSATENLARLGNYSFVAVTDTEGKVISSSDLTIIGQNFTGRLTEGVSKVDGQDQAAAAIGSGGNVLGHVIVRIRN